jgi:CP family cyanate transporter-like MFS transporter
MLRLVMLWFVAANMRSVILALPPVLPAVHRQLGLSEAEVGLLTTLPVLLLGAGAVLGSAAVELLGARRTVFVGLLLIGGTSALRGAGGAPLLFGATVLLGLSIALLQPVVPSIAQAWFGARVGLATAFYGNGFIAGEAIAASITLALVVPLAGGWPGALALWGLPCGLAALLFLLPAGEVAGLPAAGDGIGRRGWVPDVRDPWLWRLGLFQAGGSALYFGTNAFVPTELHAVGHGGLVSPALAALNVSQLGAVVVVGLLAHRGAPVRPLMVGCAAAAAGGLALIAFFPGPLAVVGCGVVGLASACGFVVALALPAMVAGPSRVHPLSAGMFTIGYLGAFLVPLAGGVLWDATGEPRTAFLPGAIGVALVGGALLRRPAAGTHDPVARLV